MAEPLHKLRWIWPWHRCRSCDLELLAWMREQEKINRELAERIAGCQWDIAGLQVTGVAAKEKR